MIKIGSIKTCALAAALAMALPLAHAATVTPAISAKVNLRSMPANQSFDRFIVTYVDGSTEKLNANAATQNVSAAVSRAGFNRATRSSTGATIAGMSVKHLRKLAIGSQLMRTSRKLSKAEATTLMAQIASDPSVAHVEADVMMQAVGDFAANQAMQPATVLTGAPNDPLYAQYQWHMKAPSSSNKGTANVAPAWTLADGADVTVAVLDTGITAHPDIDESLAADGYDFITDSFVSGRDTDGRVAGAWDTGDWTTGDEYASCRKPGSTGSKSSWHGTHVSGTIAELTDNETGMAGVAHAAKVLPVRVLGHCGGYTSDIVDGIIWASGGHVDGVPDNQHPAQVLSMSLGGAGTCVASDASGKAIADAIARGVTVVVAAGNDNENVSNHSPASCPGVIAVASNGITGKRAFYSNYGTGVSISAPGGGIYKSDASSGDQNVPNGFVWSTVNLGDTVPTDPGYGGMAGTSQATPHVSGVVAMILGAEKDAGITQSTPAEIRNILSSTARPFPVAQDQPIGVGIVDANAAVLKAIDTSGGDQPPATVLTANSPLPNQAGAIGASALYSITVPAGARNLSLRSYGGTGDVTMFVKAGAAPAEDGSDADATSARPGNTETAVIRAPMATTYYIRIMGVVTYSKLTLLASYSL